MLEIDGSYGEGGGQIIRTAVSFSISTKTPITIFNIRANRPNPGLRPQHYTALSIMKTLSNAETSGLQIGSSKIVFQPGILNPGSFEFDIGTAGSIVLVFQTILLGMLQTNKTISVRLRGGTDVKWAPSYDYFSEVFLPVVRDMGVNASSSLFRRGYYPKGGGDAELLIEPTIEPLERLYLPEYHPKHVQGNIHLGNLPDHIAKRIKHAIAKEALKQDVLTTIQTERAESDSPGVGVTLWTVEDGGKLGSVGLGERGIPAEKVGLEAIISMLFDISCAASVDPYLADQILPYAVLAKGGSRFRVRNRTKHFETNLWVLKQFFPDLSVSFVDNGKSSLVSIS